MRFDPVGSRASRSALAAQPPAELVERHVILATVLGSRQLERRRDRRAPPTDDGNLNGFRRAHSRQLEAGCAGQRLRGTELQEDSFYATRTTPPSRKIADRAPGGTAQMPVAAAAAFGTVRGVGGGRR